MRSDRRSDQAEGLRRLLVRNHARVIAVLAGKRGAGCASTVINLAAAMAHSGKEVLVLDENHAHDNPLDHLGLHTKHDLLDIVREKCQLHEAISNTRGFAVLSTGRTIDALAQLKPTEQQRMEDVLSELSDGVDVILVDAVMPAMNKTEPLSGQFREVSGLVNEVSLLVVVDATASGITEGYALIKRLALELACSQFEIVMNKASDEKAATMIFDNMAKVARSNLGVHLEYLGHIPHDDKLRRATQLGRPVIEAFPAAASAQAYQDLSQRLLHLPVRQSETGGEVHSTVQNLMKHVSQPLRQRSKKVAHVVN